MMYLGSSSLDTINNEKAYMSDRNRNSDAL